MKVILHLSQTDIRSDSRILKTMNVFSRQPNKYSVFGIGILSQTDTHFSKESNNKIFSIKISSKNWRFIPKNIKNFISVIEFLFKALRKGYSVKPDLIHCNDILALPLAVLLKLTTGAKLIYDAHELESDRNGLNKYLGKITLLFEKLTWRHIDGLIVVSGSIEQWYHKNIGKKRSEVVLNSPLISNKSGSNYGDNYLRKKFSIPQDCLIFIYVGVFIPGRSIELIVESFKSEKIKSHVVFLGYRDLRNYLLEQSELYENIHVHNSVPHGEVIDIVQSADIGFCLIENVSLSDYFSLPNKLFEYAFSGVYILASNFPDMSVLIDEYKLGAYCNLDIDSIVSKINDIESLKNIPTIDVGSLHPISWDAQECKINSIYNDLLSINK